MSILCEEVTFYHNLGPGVNGTSLLNQTLYGDSSGGTIMDGYYSDGTYIYTVSGSLVTYVETAASLGCQGTTPEPTVTPTPQGYSQQLGYGTSPTNACNNFSVT